jgi:hypothetical protein
MSLRRPIPNDPFDLIMSQLDELESQIEELQNNRAPTVPFYDSANWPAQAVEGQVVIAPRFVPVVPTYPRFIEYNSYIDDSSHDRTYLPGDNATERPFYWYYNTLQELDQLLVTNDVQGSAGYDTSAGYGWLRANRAFDTGYTDDPGLGWNGDFYYELVTVDSAGATILLPVVKADATHKNYALEITAGWYGGFDSSLPTSYPFTLNAYVVSIADVSAMFVDEGAPWHYSKIRPSAVPTWSSSVTLTPSVLSTTITETYRSADYPDPPHAIIISGLLDAYEFGLYMWHAHMRITRPL